MHDIRNTGGIDGHSPEQQRFPRVNLHPEHAGHAPGRTGQPSATPGEPGLQSDWTAPVQPDQPMQENTSYEVRGTPSTPPSGPVEPVRPEPAPVTIPRDDENRRSLTRSLRTIKIGLLVLTIILGLAVFYFLSQSQPDTTNSPSSAGPASQAPTDASTSSATRPVSCTGSTGPDATTESQSFQDVEGTECTYRSGPTTEVLILNGKLTGRNTEGTGMSVTINVNGKACNGGESLNYARTYTPMVSNCVFEVPANSSVAIKWQFLSPFGGSASVLRSSKNIAPSITGVAIPKLEEGSEE